jgi:hypothetical protein
VPKFHGHAWISRTEHDHTKNSMQTISHICFRETDILLLAACTMNLQAATERQLSVEPDDGRNASDFTS